MNQSNGNARSAVLDNDLFLIDRSEPTEPGTNEPRRRRAKTGATSKSKTIGGADAAPVKTAPVKTLTKPARGRAKAAIVETKAQTAAPVVKAPVEPKAGEHEKTSQPLTDFEALSQNMARAIEEGGKVLAAYLRPRETGETKMMPGDELATILNTFGKVVEYYASDAQRSFHAQSSLSQQFVNLWATTLMRLQGDDAPPAVTPDKGDKRFADPEWSKNPYFDFIKQAYVMTGRWAEGLVKNADELDPHTRDKAGFYLKQVVNALAPTNFVPTNPDLIRTTLAENGENLVRGLHMMAEDMEKGHGNLRIRQADASKFELGVNVAVTPGKVIYRNDLMELIQYSPTTPEVYKRPLLIVAPWINKFYILDLNPEKSFIRWAVDQGLTVFVISWVNPDERHADKAFEAYMREGIFAALDTIEKVTGEKNVAAVGYCVGGTLLSVTLAHMAAINDKRIESATLFTTQVDFADPGDLKVFCDAEQLKILEQRMTKKGYLEGSQMAGAFNMLRPNDLIWSYWVNNYLKGKDPAAFDLLVWNSDSTRMPAANHRFYLKHCYLQNDLSAGRMPVDGKPIHLGEIKIPIYNLAAREDHIAPARSVFNGAKFFGGPMRYVLSGSGHIAGVINPPYKPKYQYWTGGPVEGEFEDWVARAKETAGSWWPDWIEWIRAQAPDMVPARPPGGGKLNAIAEAPGDYVRVRV